MKQSRSACSYLTVSLLSTLLRRDGTSLYRNILRLETDFVNCSDNSCLSVKCSPMSLRLYENVVNDRLVPISLFFFFSIIVQRFVAAYRHGEVTSQNLWPRHDRHFVGITWHNVTS